jgi:hypothetical protein
MTQFEATPRQEHYGHQSNAHDHAHHQGEPPARYVTDSVGILKGVRDAARESALSRNPPPHVTQPFGSRNAGASWMRGAGTAPAAGTASWTTGPPGPPQDTQSVASRNAGASWMRGAGTAPAASTASWTSGPPSDAGSFASRNAGPRLGQRTVVRRGITPIRSLCPEEAGQLIQEHNARGASAAGAVGYLASASNARTTESGASDNFGEGFDCSDEEAH